MRYLRFTAIAILIVIWPVGVLAQKISKQSIASEGKKRNYYLYVPSNVTPTKPAPLIVLLHGSNRNGLSLVEKWKALADQEGVILVGPDSADSSRWMVPGDGPTFIYDLVEAIKALHPINPRRVYLFGHSGGAIFALMQSLYESEYFAATAIHAGALYQESAPLLEIAKRKIPIYLVVGSKDPLFPVATVRATRDAFEARAFPVQLSEIPGHTHWYYDLAPKINEAAWQFLKAHELSTDPRFEKYNFKSDDSKSRAALEQYNRGLKLYGSGDIVGAIAAYTKAIDIDTKFAAAYNNRAIAHMARNDYAAAVADFTRSIELEPSEIVYNNRAGAYFSQKQFAEGIADFTAGIKLKPTAAGYTNRGVAYEQTGQPTLALADYESAIKLEPKFGRAYALRGLVALRAGQSAAAQKDFEKAFELDPGLRTEFDPIIKQLQIKQ